MKNINEKVRFLIYIRKSKETNLSNSVSLKDQYLRIKRKLLEDYNYNLLENVNISFFDELSKLSWRWNEKEKEVILFELEKYWIFVENKSAFKIWRDRFDRMIQISKWLNFEGFVIWKASRLARNNEDWERILKFAFDPRERYDFICLEKEYPKTIEWKMSLSMDLLEAHKESLLKSRDWKYNYDSTFTISWKLPFKTPYWYIRTIHDWIYKIEIDNNKYWNSDKDKDEQKDVIIRKIFDYYDSWTCLWYDNVAKEISKTYKKIVIKKIKDQNGRILKTTKIKRDFTWKDIENIINNPLYWWILKIEYKNLKKEEIKEFKWRYPNIEIKWNSIEIDYSEDLRKVNWYFPILLENENENWDIAREIYKKVQDTIHGRVTTNQKIALSHKGKLDFTYKTSNIICKYCWSLITWEKKWKWRNDNYRCSCLDKSKCMWKYKYIWEKLLEKQFLENVINKINFNNFELLNEYIKKALENLWNYHEKVQVNNKQEIQNLKNEILSITNRVTSISCNLDMDIQSQEVVITNLQKLKKEKELSLLELEKWQENLDNNEIDINEVNINYIKNKLLSISTNYNWLNLKQKNVVFSNFIEHIKFDWPNKRLDWENCKLSHIVEIISTNVQYFNKFHNKSPKNYCTWKNGTKKASSNDDAKNFPYGKECRNWTYVYWLRKPVTLRIKLTP